MHGAYVSEEETHAVVAYLEEHGPTANYIPDLVQTETAKKRGPAEKDDLYDQAVELVRRRERASISMLQRRLKIGYTRAARLIEQLEEDGIIGPPTEGSKPREVLDYGDEIVEDGGD